MKKYLLFLLLFASGLYSQDLPSEYKYGTKTIYNLSGNDYLSKMVTIPERVDGKNDFQNSVFDFYNPRSSYIIWDYFEPTAICDYLMLSADGKYGIVTWDLNSKRVALFGNQNNIPLWEYPVSSNTWYNYVGISDTAGYIVVGSYQNILMFSRQNNVPIFNFDLTTLPDTGTAGPVDITGDGKFIIACANRGDTSTIFGFNRDTSISVWKFRVPTAVQGVRMSGNDSIAIVNTYSAFWVVNTFTGNLIFQGPITNGTQTAQGISGNGNLIAIIDYKGYLTVFQKNGTTYTQLWQHQEPPGTYYNWMTAVSFTYDGSLLACGTLNFLSSSSFDGKVKLFHSTNSTPIWTYTGLGDEVSKVAFSKNAKILSASSWGDFAGAHDDYVAFRVPGFSSTPIFSLNTPGSLFDGSISDDGTAVLTGGKRVHARAFGNGGELYNIFIDTNSGSSGIHNGNDNPVSFKLYQNYPNPFNNQTKIEFDIPKSGLYKISVFDILGREVKVLAADNYKQGNHSVLFNAENLSSGIYYYKITSDYFNDMKRMVLIK